MALVSQAELEARLQRSLTGEETSAFTLINAALQAYAEKMIGASLESASLSNRFYNGGWQHLKIDPCTDIDSVVLVDDDYVAVDTYDTSDYAPAPVNQTLKQSLIHRSGAFVSGINNIRVRAKFSISADTQILNIVKDALLGALVAEMQNSNNVIKESIEGYSIEFATSEAKAHLSRIKYIFPEII